MGSKGRDGNRDSGDTRHLLSGPAFPGSEPRCFFPTRPADWKPRPFFPRNNPRHHLAPDNAPGKRLAPDMVARRPANPFRFGPRKWEALAPSSKRPWTRAAMSRACPMPKGRLTIGPRWALDRRWLGGPAGQFRLRRRAAFPVFGNGGRGRWWPFLSRWHMDCVYLQ